MYGMERRRSASQREVGSSGNMGTELAGRTQGQGRKPRPRGNSVLSVCPEELRLAVVRPKTVKTSRRKGFVVSAWRSLCCSDGVSFAPARVCSFSEQGPLQPREDEDKARFACPFGVCSDFAPKAARREHQTNFEELEGLIVMVSCLHETVLPAAPVGLLGISPCWEATSETDDVAEVTAEALAGSLFLPVRASQFCVAPAGHSKFRSGG